MAACLKKKSPMLGIARNYFVYLVSVVFPWWIIVWVAMNTHEKKINAGVFLILGNCQRLVIWDMSVRIS